MSDTKFSIEQLGSSPGLDVPHTELRLNQLVSLTPHDFPSGATPTWKFVTVPEGSTVSFSPNEHTLNVTFTPDVWGTYIIQLLSSDSVTPPSSLIAAVKYDASGNLLKRGWRYPAAGETPVSSKHPLGWAKPIYDIFDDILGVITTGGGGFIAAGDLSGDATSQEVVGIRTRPVDSAAPNSGDILIWNGTAWTPGPQSGGSFSPGGDLSGNSSNQTVIGIQTHPVSNAAPNNGDVLIRNGTNWAPGPQSGGSGSVTGTYTDASGGTISVGSLVYISSDDSVNLASSNNESTADVVGIATAVSSGNVTVQYAGEVSAFSGLSAGQTYYLNSTGGLTTSTTESVVKKIGIAKNSTTLVISMEPMILS